MTRELERLIKAAFGQFSEAIYELLAGYTDSEAESLLQNTYNKMQDEKRARTAYQAERAQQQETRKAEEEKAYATIAHCNAHYTTNPKAAHRPRDLIQEE